MCLAVHSVWTVRCLSQFIERETTRKSKTPNNLDMMLHHDNAPAHASLLIRSYLAKHQTPVVPHPHYSPDLTPPDFFLFPKLKTALKGRRFQTMEEVQEYAIRELRVITESAFQEALQQRKKHWERCIASRVDYFEGDST
jgi:hypothetical protein